MQLRRCFSGGRVQHRRRWLTHLHIDGDVDALEEAVEEGGDAADALVHRLQRS